MERLKWNVLIVLWRIESIVSNERKFIELFLYASASPPSPSLQILRTEKKYRKIDSNYGQFVEFTLRCKQFYILVIWQILFSGEIVYIWARIYHFFFLSVLDYMLLVSVSKFYFFKFFDCKHFTQHDDPYLLQEQWLC